MIVDLASAVDQPRRFDTRLAILLREDLATWQKLNVTAFLVSGVVAAVDGTTGDAYEDADGTQYLPMIREPITVLAGDRAELTDAHRRVVDRGLLLTIFTEELFSTPNDQANWESPCETPGVSGSRNSGGLAGGSPGVNALLVPRP
jgi:hypothetical protein